MLIQSCNHCPYVLAWEGRIARIASDYADRGVSVVAIGSNDSESHPEDSFPAMVQHAKEQAFPFDYLHDEDQALARALGSERTPEVFVFDRNRTLVYHGAVDDSRDEDQGAHAVPARCARRDARRTRTRSLGDRAPGLHREVAQLTRGAVAQSALSDCESVEPGAWSRVISIAIRPAPKRQHE